MRRWATRCAWPSSTSSPSRTGRRSSCAIASASSRTCWPTTSTCSSGSAWSSGPAPAATAAAATCTCGPTRSTAWRRSARSTLGEALFVCTANSARSPARRRGLAGGHRPRRPPRPAPTPPARSHPGAVAAARRACASTSVVAGPARSTRWAPMPPLVVTVCDRAHEELRPASGWLHWSIPDPVPDGSERRVRRRRRRAAPADRHPRRRATPREQRPGPRPFLRSTDLTRAGADRSTPPTASSPSRSRPAPVRSASTWPGAWRPRPSAPAC